MCTVVTGGEGVSRHGREEAGAVGAYLVEGVGRGEARVVREDNLAQGGAS